MAGNSQIDPREPQPSFWSNPQMRYPNIYTWVVLLASLDGLLTLFVLYLWEGSEVNPIAAAVIETMGPYWAGFFTLATVVVVCVILEVLGRCGARPVRRLATAAVVVNALPVAYTFALLLRAGPATVVG